MKIYSGGKALNIMGPGGGCSGGEIYSTEEILIGTWFDAPLYAKTYVLAAPDATTPSGGTAVIGSIPPTHTARRAQGGLETKDGTFIALPFAAGSLTASIYIDGSNNIRMTLTHDDWRNAQVNLTVKYTKTTD